jgi:hypothetical protein
VELPESTKMPLSPSRTPLSPRMKLRPSHHASPSSKTQSTCYSTRSTGNNESGIEIEQYPIKTEQEELPPTSSCSLSSTHKRLMAAVKGTISRVRDANSCVCLLHAFHLV